MYNGVFQHQTILLESFDFYIDVIDVAQIDWDNDDQDEVILMFKSNNPIIIDIKPAPQHDEMRMWNDKLYLEFGGFNTDPNMRISYDSNKNSNHDDDFELYTFLNFDHHYVDGGGDTFSGLRITNWTVSPQQVSVTLRNTITKNGEGLATLTLKLCLYSGAPFIILYQQSEVMKGGILETAYTGVESLDHREDRVRLPEGGIDEIVKGQHRDEFADHHAFNPSWSAFENTNQENVWGVIGLSTNPTGEIWTPIVEDADPIGKGSNFDLRRMFFVYYPDNNGGLDGFDVGHYQWTDILFLGEGKISTVDTYRGLILDMLEENTDKTDSKFNPDTQVTDPQVPRINLPFPSLTSYAILLLIPIIRKFVNNTVEWYQN